MLRALRNFSMLAVLGLSIGLAGCQNPKGMNKDDETAVSLADKVKQLTDELNRAEGQHQQDQAQIDALRRELEALRSKGGAAVATGWTGVPGGAMIAIEGTVLFDSGKADLKSSSKKVLAQVAAAIKQTYPDREVYVFGHTDADPIKRSHWKDNYELSCQRSLSVARFLQSDGVGNYMAACGWGEHRPVAANNDKASKQSNRRVEIFAMNPPGAK